MFWTYLEDTPVGSSWSSHTNMVRLHLRMHFRCLNAFYVGDVVHLSVLGQSIIVLSTEQVMRKLLEKRATNYSDRPAAAMAKLYVPLCTH